MEERNKSNLEVGPNLGEDVLLVVFELLDRLFDVLQGSVLKLLLHGGEGGEPASA